jgi:hypothetical protein
VAVLRVLVCGGRQFKDAAFLSAKLDELHRQYRFTTLIEGDAEGADRMAGAWADANGIELLVYPADWENLKRKAGPIRNKQMLDEGKPDLVVAFPGTSGTFNMCRQAEAAGVPVIAVPRAAPAG